MGILRVADIDLHAVNEKLLKLALWHPPIRRGAMTLSELRLLVHRIAKKRGLKAIVMIHPWPFRGSVQRDGGWLIIHIDSRQGLDGVVHPDILRLMEVRQIIALAHEVGHVALGHYQLQEEGVWFHSDGGGDDAFEWEAEYFADVVTLSPGQFDRIVSPQSRLL
jgi:hypothetical protein